MTTSIVASILLVEDDPGIRRSLSLSLADEGYDVVDAADGEKGLEALTAHTERIDVVLLDLMLPGRDGLSVCREIREASDVPIIIVSARTDTKDVIAGLEAGADDYVTKPLVASELNARIRALLRRARTLGGPEVYDLGGGLSLDAQRGTVEQSGEPIHLTKTEFRLLCELATARGQVVSREHLLEKVWGYGYFGDSRLIDVHIMRLRRKIEPDTSNPTVIVTSRGLGFRIENGA